jgi:hypothetical protein
VSKAALRPRRQRSGSRRYPYSVSHTLGPVVGVREEPDPTAFDPSLALAMQNLLPMQSEYGSGVQTRPGFERIGTSLSGAAPQGSVQYTKADGTTISYVFYTGKLYRVDWRNAGVYAPTLTDVTPTAGSTAPVGWSISTTATRVYAVNFANYLIVSDGVGKVWKWDGTNATYLTDGTDGSATGVAFGPLTVYYNKLFYIRDDNRRMFVWSEEGDPDLGYLSTDYNNFWTYAQTGSAPLVALVGTNDALYVFRQTSIGAVTGAVRSDFASSGTHDAIDQNVGCGAAASLALVGNSMYFLDASARPWRLDPGRGLSPLWEQCASSAEVYFEATLTADATGGFGTAYAPGWGVVLMGHHLGTNASIKQVLVFDHDTGRYLGQWKHRASDSRAMLGIGQLIHASGEPTVCFGDASGNAWILATPANDATTDGPSALAIETSVTFPLVGGDDPADKLWDRIVARIRARSGTSYTLVFDYRTSRLTYQSTQSASSGTVTPSDVEQKVEVGINGHGRLLGARVAQSAATVRYVLTTVTVAGFAVGDETTAP